MPGLSSIQDDKVRFRSYYIQLLGILAIVTMPIAGFIFIASEPITSVILGEKWMPVAPIMKWLAVAAFLQPVAGLYVMVLIAQGLAKRHLHSGLISGIFLSIVFIITVNYGVETLAMAYAATGYILFVPIFLYVSRNTGISLKDFFLGIWRAALSTVGAVFVVYLFDFYNTMESQFLRLTLEFIQFSFFYFVFLLIIPGGKSHLLSLKNRLKQALSKN